MKNEKLTKNELKEKMMKKFDTGIFIAWAIRNFFIIVAVFFLLVFTVSVIEETVQYGESNVIQTAIQVGDEIIASCNSSNNSNLVFAMGLIFRYIFITIICDRIGRVFKDSKKAETPFCEANVRNIEIISGFAWGYTLFIEGFASYELVVATLISVIYYIFKYGCELQEQSDETL